MTNLQISFIINGIENLLREPSREIIVEAVTFRTRETQKVGSITLQCSDADASSVLSGDPDTNPIILETLDRIDKALGSLCFAFYVEASVFPGSCYVRDLTNTPNLERIHKPSKIRTASVKENPTVTLNKIKSLPLDRKKTLDLALRYYKLSDISNPYRIESYFSCMSVIVRSIEGIAVNAWLSTSILKENIGRILIESSSQFSKEEFENKWMAAHENERNPAAHGGESKLADITKLEDYTSLANIVGSWARILIYYYIDRYTDMNKT